MVTALGSAVQYRKYVVRTVLTRKFLVKYTYLWLAQGGTQKSDPSGPSAGILPIVTTDCGLPRYCTVYEGTVQDVSSSRAYSLQPTANSQPPNHHSAGIYPADPFCVSNIKPVELRPLIASNLQMAV